MQQFVEEKSDEARRPHDPYDPYLWLEDIDGEQAQAWVAERNAVSERELECRPGFAPLRERLKAILDSSEKIPYVGVHGGRCYNFWRDAGHVRGILRRTDPQSYIAGKPEWETVLDIDTPVDL